MSWTLRRAAADDIDRLAVVGAATFLDAFAGVIDGDAVVAHCLGQHDAATYRALLAKRDAAAWLAEIGGAPVGYSLLCPPDLPGAQAGDIELKRIYALSRFQGSGIGAALLAPAAAHARNGSAARLLLGVYQGNARAIAFYRREGFAVIGTRSFAVGSATYQDWVMALPL
ncbi:GNAT family N-acetyltransferase [Sphingomonas japonica]|uniref:Ribosomal protein S18 acetylase RimI-like enzyme n=1 Tax=Sphingomonas japonica TaxID=511662 RepID=A0ABX0U2D4_9SPHN|nr:GNAT family N-acetyltransferase [Sphingomonas japonica]NIJ23527.1 ribosomal protein S18 acetylase RimI-like enzyme [Sphingomonas japonica]